MNTNLRFYQKLPLISAFVLEFVGLKFLQLTQIINYMLFMQNEGNYHFQKAMD